MSSEVSLKSIKELSAVLDRKKQLELWKNAVDGDKEAAAQIALSMRHLIIFEAKKLGIRSDEVEDVVQSAILEILKNLHKYDPTKGVKLSTYLAPLARKSAQEWFRRNKGSITFPRETKKAIASVGPRPTHKSLEKLSEQLHRKPQTLLNAIRSAMSSVSLEAPIGSDSGDGKFLEEVLVTEQANSPESAALKEIARDIIEQAIKEVLTRREQEAVILRFGLNGNEPCTYIEIAQALSVSGERARQIVNEAKEKIKNYLCQDPRKISFLKNVFE